MNIVFVTAFFTDMDHVPLTGMPGYVYKIANCLRKRGHNTVIMAGAEDDRRWVYRGIPVQNVQKLYGIDGSNLEIAFSLISREISFQRALRKLNEEMTVDIVQYAGWSGTGMFHSIDCPAVLRLSTYSKIQYSNNEVFGNYARVYSFFERLSGYRADGIIAPGKKIGISFSKDIKKRVTLIETPYVEESKYDESEYKSIKGIRYFLFFGTASRDKGFEVLSKAIPHILKAHKDIAFVFAGWNIWSDGKSSVERLSIQIPKEDRDRFIYLGPLKHELLLPIIRNSEFVVIPSIIDNLPNSCIEAMFLDRLVVGTKGSSIEQLIIDGRNGFLVNPGDVNDLLNGIEKAISLTDKDKRRMMKDIRLLRKPYMESTAVTKLEQYYVSLIRKHKKNRLL